jgi:hypothetical protein
MSCWEGELVEQPESWKASKEEKSSAVTLSLTCGIGPLPFRAPLTLSWVRLSEIERNPLVWVRRACGSRIFGRTLGGYRPEVDRGPAGVQRLLRFPTAHVEGVGDDPGSRL